jgi:hypothetical protein
MAKRDDMKVKYSNQHKQEYTEKKAINIFIDMLAYVEDEGNDCLSLYGAINKSPVSFRHAYYLRDKFPVCAEIMDDMKSCIMEKINHGALTGTYNPTAAIWRSKQFGETDRTEVNQHVTGETTQKRIIIKDYSDDKVS